MRRNYINTLHNEIKKKKDVCLDELKKSTLTREKLIALLKKYMNLVGENLPDQLESTEKAEVFLDIYHAIIKLDSVRKTIMEPDTNGQTYEDAAEHLKQLALIHPAIAQDILDNITSPIGAQTLLKSQKRNSHLTEIANKHKIYFLNYRDIRKKLEEKYNDLINTFENVNPSPETLTKTIKEYILFFMEIVPKPIAPNALRLCNNYLRMPVVYKDELIDQKPILNQLKIIYDYATKNPFFKNTSVEHLTDIALLHPKIACLVIKQFKDRFSESKNTFEHLIKIAEKHGNHGIDGEYEKSVADYFNIRNTHKLSQVMNSPKNITNKIIRISKNHPDYAIEHFEAIFKGDLYKDVKTYQLISLTDQYPELAHYFILELPSNKTYLPYLKKLLQNLQKAAKNKDPLSELTVALLKFSGVLFTFIERDPEKAIKLCIKIIETDNRHYHYTDHYTGRSIRVPNQSLKRAGHLLASFAVALYYGKALDVTILENYKGKLLHKTDAYYLEPGNVKSSSSLGLAVKQDILLAEELFRIAQKHTQSPMAKSYLSDSRFQLDLAHKYLSGRSSGTRQLLANYRAFQLLKKSSQSRDNKIRAKSYHCLAELYRKYKNTTPYNPILAAEAADFFYNNQDMETVYPLIQEALFGAQHLSKIPELDQEVKASLQDLSTRMHDYCFTLVTQFYTGAFYKAINTGNQQEQQKVRAQIQTLLSLIPETHPNYGNAAGLLNLMNMPRKVTRSNPNGNYSLPKKKEAKLLLSLYKEALKSEYGYDAATTKSIINALENQGDGKPAVPDLWNNQKKINQTDTKSKNSSQHSQSFK